MVTPGQHQRTAVSPAVRANRPSHEGVVDLYDRAIALVRRWGSVGPAKRRHRLCPHGQLRPMGVRGRALCLRLRCPGQPRRQASSTDDELYHELARRAERAIKTQPRQAARNVKDASCGPGASRCCAPPERTSASSTYRPGACRADYRVVALRKNLSVERGENVLFNEYRWFFYITNRREATVELRRGRRTRPAGVATRRTSSPS